MGGRDIQSACPRSRRTPLGSLQARKEMEAKKNVGGVIGLLSFSQQQGSQTGRLPLECAAPYPFPRQPPPLR